MTKTDPIIHNAAVAIYKATKENSNITLDGLKRELEDGLIEGWLSIPEVRECNFYQWSAAMDLVIFTMATLKELETKE